MRKPHEVVYFGKSLEKGRLSETEFFIYHVIENSEVEIKPCIVNSANVYSLMNYLKGACFGKTVNPFELVNGIPEALNEQKFETIQRMNILNSRTPKFIYVGDLAKLLGRK